MGSIMPKGLSVDVLIVGGGIQGLYLLDKISSSYSVCMITSPLTDSQTMSSHGFIAKGYTSLDDDYISLARKASAVWEDFFNENKIEYGNQNVFYSFLPVDRQLIFEKHNISIATDGANYFAEEFLTQFNLFKTNDEFIVNHVPTVGLLQKKHNEKIVEGVVNDVKCSRDKTLEKVYAVIEKNKVEIHPKFVVFAAGLGNIKLQGLLKKNDSVCPISIRVIHMLCIKGRGLPVVSGILSGLSVVSRQDPITNEITMLISDYRTKIFLEKNMEPKDYSINNKIVKSLFSKITRVLKKIPIYDEDMRFSAYVGMQTYSDYCPERGAMSFAGYMDSLNLKNAVMINPNQWSFSPILASEVNKLITQRFNDMKFKSTMDKKAEISNFKKMEPVIVTKWSCKKRNWLSMNEFKLAYFSVNGEKDHE